MRNDLKRNFDSYSNKTLHLGNRIKQDYVYKKIDRDEVIDPKPYNIIAYPLQNLPFEHLESKKLNIYNNANIYQNHNVFNRIKEMELHLNSSEADADVDKKGENED